uniref:RmlD-like substrate binding domain-containing protein n=1 Tax=viral metagenome TaxID=1070528 RepID=A0A6C0I416_9ZZZZ
MADSILENSLITGGSGMVGANIFFGKKPSSVELDVTNIVNVNNYFDTNKDISCIIHLAALNLRDSENNTNKAIDVNINGTINMLNVAKRFDIPFVLVSSGAVFSSFNSNMKFSENEHPSPNCVYGSTKYASEKVAQTYNKSIIIRTGWLFGGNQKSHHKFVEHAFNNMNSNNKVICCDDFYGSTTYVVDLIDKMKELIKFDRFGIHHVVNDGVSTGTDIGLLIAKLLNKPSELVVSRSFSNVPNCGPKRSLTEVLITNSNVNKLRNWQDSLTEYISLLMSKLSIPIQHSIQESNKWRMRTKCRLCNSENMIDFYNLEPTPPANHFIRTPKPQETIPLDLLLCINCNHIQLKEILDPRFLYSDYFYVSSTSNTMTNHLKESVIKFTKLFELNLHDNILEIGANDGVCIRELIDNGFTNVVGIDPAVNIHSRHSLPIICDFFGSGSKDVIMSNYSSYKLIYAFHCMAHIEDIQDVFKTIFALLDDNGVFIMEVGYFYDVFKSKQFDVIYHEHIDYHTCSAMNNFAKINNLFLFDITKNDIQGGSIQFYFSKNKDIVINENVEQAITEEVSIGLFHSSVLSNWKYSIEKICYDINSIINSLVNNGKKIAGYGASAKSTTLLYQLKISKNTLKYIIDDNIYKQNHFSPGLNIPIKSSDTLSNDKIDYIIILSCNFSGEIVTRLANYRKTGLRIIIPFPEIRII